MVNAFRAGTIVAVLAGAGRLVHGAAAAELRRAHARRRRLPRRGRLPSLIGVSATYGFFAFAVVAALVIARACRRSAAARYSEESAVIGHRAGLRARLRLPVRQPLRRLPRRRQRAAVRQLPRHHRSSQVAVLAGGRGRGRSAVARRHRPAAALRLGRPRRGRAPAAYRCGAARRPSWCCSASPRPRSARSPARCWCSRCWSCRPATAQR